jgi:hypothetical protein
MRSSDHNLGHNRELIDPEYLDSVPRELVVVYFLQAVTWPSQRVLAT